jgi:hypothetical protein
MVEGAAIPRENEQRRYIRHPSDIPILVELESVVASRQEYLHDISAGGLCFASRVPLPVGTRIRIRIPLVRPIFECLGSVVWCEADGDYFDVGVEFLHIREAFRMRLIEQICHIEHYKREIHRKEGRALTGEQAAMEWIAKYAATFPPITVQPPPADT